MKKTKKKYSTSIYLYTTPSQKLWVKIRAAELGMNSSEFLNVLVDHARGKKTTQSKQAVQ